MFVARYVYKEIRQSTEHVFTDLLSCVRNRFIKSTDLIGTLFKYIRRKTKRESVRDILLSSFFSYSRLHACVPETSVGLITI